MILVRKKKWREEGVSFPPEIFCGLCRMGFITFGPFHKAWAVKNDSRPGCLTFVRPIGLF